MPWQSETRKKMCSPPKLNKLTPEQANLILIGYASCGDQGAKDLLDVLCPPEPEGITMFARISRTRNLPKSYLEPPG